MRISKTRFIREIVKGRRDYENFLLMTIGINTNYITFHVTFICTNKQAKLAFFCTNAFD